jgi:hypothetical protein
METFQDGVAKKFVLEDYSTLTPGDDVRKLSFVK